MSTDPSWRLKIARAKKHLSEVEEELRNYSDRHPYEAIRDRQSQQNPNVRRFRLRLTEHPDPMLAVIIGDFLYDLRSALDHLAVSLAPRKWIRDISFPVATVDPWKQPATDAEREDLLKRRGRFESSIKGMPGAAVTFTLVSGDWRETR